jgi:Na+/melibiose symporter-like transporter
VEAAAPSLWRNRAFLRLWFAGIVSGVGGQVTALALPLTAVVALDATPADMGLLRGAGIVPDLLLVLFAGVWVDRVRRQTILIGAELGHALLLGSIPLAVLAGGPTLPHLWFVAFAVGTLAVFASLASISILPALVPKAQLVEANSRMTVTGAVLTIAGPNVAGGLVQLVGAPKAILVDAVSHVLSALSLRGVGRSEVVERRAGGTSTWQEIGEGVRELVRTPLLRSLTLSISVGAFGLGMQSTVQLLFLVNELGFSPALVGVAAGCGGAGSLVGAALAARAARRLGTGPTIVLGNAVWAAGGLIVPLAGLGGGDLLVVAAGQAVASAGGSLWGVTQMSLRQAITPVGLFARATAARRIPMSGMQLAGAMLGGVLGGAIGLRATLVVGALGLVAAALLLVLSPVRAVRDVPDAAAT